MSRRTNGNAHIMRCCLCKAIAPDFTRGKARYDGLILQQWDIDRNTRDALPYGGFIDAVISAVDTWLVAPTMQPSQFAYRCVCEWVCGCARLQLCEDAALFTGAVCCESRISTCKLY